MKVIWKFQFHPADKVSLYMPKNAQILSVQAQGGVGAILALCDPKVEHKHRLFTVIGTGQEFDPTGLNYIATYQAESLVWHLFEPIKSI